MENIRGWKKRKK